MIHRHDYRPVAVDCHADYLFSTNYTTQVLSNCACGAHRVEKLPGRWSLEQVIAGTRPEGTGRKE